MNEITETKEKKVLYTEAQKRAIYNWRNKNREAFNVIMRPHRKKYYEDHKELLAQKKSYKYYYHKELKIFLNILLP